MLTSIFVFRQR